MRNRWMIAAVLFWLAFALWAPHVCAISTGSLQTGLVAYWKLGEASNTSRLDSSGNGHNLLDQNSRIAKVAGKLGDAAAFVGDVNDNLVTADSVGFPHGAQNFSISAWFYLPSPNTNANNVIASKYYAASNLSWSLRYNATSGRANFTYSTTGANALACAFDAAALSLDAWHHYVISYNTGAGTIDNWIDGAARTQCTGVAGWFDDGTTRGIAVGSEPTGVNTRHLTGRVDEVGIWSKPLTAAEVAALYNVKNGTTYPFGPPAMLFGGL